MAIMIDWPTKTFSVPQGDLTHISGTLYELSTETDFRQEVNAIMGSEEGIVFEDSLSHNTEYTVAGVTYARKIELINAYRIKFTPDSQWSVRLAGSNNNLFDVENDVLVQNQVQVIAQNSAGLQTVVSGSGVTEQDKLDIADRVLDELLSGHTTDGSLGKIVADAAKESTLQVIASDVEFIKDIEGGRLVIDTATRQMVIYKADGVTEVARFDLCDASGNPACENVFERKRV